MENKRIALYARTSTTDKGQDANLQLLPLREYCRARGLTIVNEYVDIGHSGAKDRRPQLDNLLHDAQKRKFDSILVWKLDRFGRSLRQLVTTLEELTSIGIGFISYQDNIDLTTPQGRLMFHIIASMAEFERELIKERVKAGIQNAQRKGIKVGRKALPELIIDKITELREQGLSIRKIADKLKLSVGAVHKTLSKMVSESGFSA